MYRMIQWYLMQSVRRRCDYNEVRLFFLTHTRKRWSMCTVRNIPNRQPFVSAPPSQGNQHTIQWRQTFDTSHQTHTARLKQYISFKLKAEESNFKISWKVIYNVWACIYFSVMRQPLDWFITLRRVYAPLLTVLAEAECWHGQGLILVV